jgi:hypothetical protein
MAKSKKPAEGNTTIQPVRDPRKKAPSMAARWAAEKATARQKKVDE